MTTRSVVLSHDQRQLLTTAAERVGLERVLELAHVRSPVTWWRAVGGGPVLPSIAHALVTAADRIVAPAPSNDSLRSAS